MVLKKPGLKKVKQFFNTDEEKTIVCNQDEEKSNLKRTDHTIYNTHIVYLALFILIK